jgi:hypothetical protein
MPTAADCKYLQKFLSEYKEADYGFVVCKTPQRFYLSENIIAIPWQETTTIFST